MILMRGIIKPAPTSWRCWRGGSHEFSLEKRRID
jgi:hypothetical protein